MYGKRYHKEYCAEALKYAIVFMMLILKGTMNTYLTLFNLAIGIFHLSLTASWAEEMLSRLTRAEKIGQLITMRVEMVDDFDSILSRIKQNHIGGIIPLHPWSVQKHTELINRVSELYQHDSTVTPLVIEDAEWGCAMRIPEITPFPRALTLGALYPNNTELIYHIGFAIGMQCKQLGIHFNCAPVVDVNSNCNNPVIGMRSFGDNPESVGHAALAYTQGMYDAGIMPCIKHFPGHGNTDADSHLQLPIIRSGLSYIETYDLAPFIYCLEHTSPAVMVGHLAVPALEKSDIICPATLSSTIINTYLKEQLGFAGLIISDGLDMLALAAYGDPGDIALQALKAGVDILLCPPDIDAVIKRITQALESGEYSDAALDNHVLKIMQLKESLGLHTQNKPALSPLEQYEDLIQGAYDAAATAWNGFNPGHNQPLEPVTLGSPMITHAPFYNPNQRYTKPLLIHLYPGNYRTHRLTDEQKNTLTAIASQHPESVVLLFGSPYCLMDIPNALPTLVLYEDTPYTHRTAQKIMDGALMPQGTLPITI